jgi:hypothetical protein
MSVAVSGATTISAVDSKAAAMSLDTTTSHSVTFLLTGLTAGSNTFTAKYRAESVPGTFSNRHLTVIGIP